MTCSSARFTLMTNLRIGFEVSKSGYLLDVADWSSGLSSRISCPSSGRARCICPACNCRPENEPRVRSLNTAYTLYRLSAVTHGIFTTRVFATPAPRRMTRSYLINAQTLEAQRMRPAIKAGLKKPIGAAKAYMR